MEELFRSVRQLNTLVWLSNAAGQALVGTGPSLIAFYQATPFICGNTFFSPQREIRLTALNYNLPLTFPATLWPPALICTAVVCRWSCITEVLWDKSHPDTITLSWQAKALTCWLPGSARRAWWVIFERITWIFWDSVRVGRWVGRSNTFALEPEDFIERQRCARNLSTAWGTTNESLHPLTWLKCAHT